MVTVVTSKKKKKTQSTAADALKGAGYNPLEENNTGNISGSSSNVPITINGKNFIVDRNTAESIINKRQQDQAFQQALNTYNQAQSGTLNPLQQAQANVSTPRAEDISSETNNPFSNFLTQEGQKGGKNSIKNIVVRSNLGQAMAGKDFLDQLRNDKNFQAQVLDLTKYMKDNHLTPEQVSSDPFVQAVLQLKLNENDIKVLEDGKADVSKMALEIEGLPVSGQITKWTGGALTPTSALKKVKDLEIQVKTLTSKMDNWNEAITKNPQLADYYDSLIDESTQTLLDLQSRIKLLTIQSPVLQNSPEEIENINQEIDKGLTKTTKLKSTVVDVRYAQ